MLQAVVPIKPLALAKGRLAPVLAPDERRALVLAMLADVLRALRQTRQISAITVVCSDDEVAALARHHGAATLPDTADSLNGALAQAAAHAIATGAEALLVLPGDVPLATLGALEALLHVDANVVLVPSRDGGTNAMLLRPPNALPFLFGVGSLARHQSAATNAQLSVQVLHDPALALDIDSCGDLRALADTKGNSEAQHLARLLLSQTALCQG